jgi:TfuA protein
MNHGEIVVFTGPSLNARKAATILDAVYMPPVLRGDLKPLCTSKTQAVAIVDGEFYQNLAISPKEVLCLLQAGVAVYGSSSMGALRAVELHPYGMIGVGIVFRLFLRGILDADDEVALAYERDTQRPVSEPLVNTRFALRAACKAGIVTPSAVREIIARVKATYFPERTADLTVHLARKVAGDDAASNLQRFLLAHPTNVKERDAELLLRRIRRELHGGTHELTR